MPLTELPAPETAYLRTLTERLQASLGARLVGVYLFGSAGYGAYEAGLSDLDVQAVISQPLSAADSRALAARISHAALPCPARKLEFVLYTRAAIAAPSRQPQFALNFNTGADQPEHLGLDPAAEASHWFLLDIAMGRELGRSLRGPPPAEVFAAPSPEWVRSALLDSLSWHREHDRLSSNTVLNACRSWRWAQTGAWGSKQSGLTWALAQPDVPAGVAQAAQARQTGESLNPAVAAAVLAFVEARLHQAPDKLD
jgi:Domain of unknown function (DUF4111)